MPALNTGELTTTAATQGLSGLFSEALEAVHWHGATKFGRTSLP
jgi:hypothetical protein